jgi:RNA polymerase sigma factor (TIGR02999 family)
MTQSENSTTEPNEAPGRQGPHDEVTGGGADDLFPQVYDELRRLAGQYLRYERRGHTLQPTALVNEAYLRLSRGAGADWQNRSHFYRVAAQTMRRILVNHAVKRKASKRGSGRPVLTLCEEPMTALAPAEDLLAVDEALKRLGEVDDVKARIVEMRYFGGLTVEMTAAALDLSPATVKRHWQVAKMWLLRELTGAGGS